MTAFYKRVRAAAYIKRRRGVPGVSRKPQRDADTGSGGGDRAPLRPAARPRPRNHRGGAAAEPRRPRLRGPRRGSRDPRPRPGWRRGGAPLRWMPGTAPRCYPALLGRGEEQ